MIVMLRRSVVQRKMYKLYKMYKCTFFWQFIHFSLVLLTKNVYSFYFFFRRGSGELRRKMKIIFFLKHFSFSVATKKV